MGREEKEEGVGVGVGGHRQGEGACFECERWVKKKKTILFDYACRSGSFSALLPISKHN